MQMNLGMFWQKFIVFCAKQKVTHCLVRIQTAVQLKLLICMKRISKVDDMMNIVHVQLCWDSS